MQIKDVILLKIQDNPPFESLYPTERRYSRKKLRSHQARMMHMIRQKNIENIRALSQHIASIQSTICQLRSYA